MPVELHEEVDEVTYRLVGVAWANVFSRALELEHELMVTVGKSLEPGVTVGRDDDLVAAVPPIQPVGIRDIVERNILELLRRVPEREQPVIAQEVARAHALHRMDEHHLSAYLRYEGHEVTHDFIVIDPFLDLFPLMPKPFARKLEEEVGDDAGRNLKRERRQLAKLTRTHLFALGAPAPDEADDTLNRLVTVLA